MSNEDLEPIITHSLKVGEYIISKEMDGSFWITDDNGDGGGMQTTPEKLEKLIADFYHKEL